MTVAQVARFAAVADFKAQFARAKGEQAPATMAVAGLEWRTTLAKLRQGNPEALAVWPVQEPPMMDRHGNPMSHQAMALLHAEEELQSRVEHVMETQGAPAASMLRGVAHGTATPLLHFVEAWLQEGGRHGPYQERSVRQFRSDLTQVSKWVEETGEARTVEAVTKKVAGAVIQARVAEEMHRKTLNRKISAASAYWDYLEKRGHTEANPWQGQSLSKGLTRAPGERPFTPAELSSLLSGPADPELADALRVALLSGARIEAIYRLTVAGCVGGWFVFPPQKREPAARRVPVHSGLIEIVARRCKGKAPGDYLFSEAGPLRDGRERSMAVSKRFGTYRQRADVNVHERAAGTRRSLVNLHSCRRTFVTLAEQAGSPPHVISAVVGHREGRAGMTLGRYSGGPSDEQLRAVVEGVRLLS